MQSGPNLRATLSRPVTDVGYKFANQVDQLSNDVLLPYTNVSGYSAASPATGLLLQQLGFSASAVSTAWAFSVPSDVTGYRMFIVSINGEDCIQCPTFILVTAPTCPALQVATSSGQCVCDAGYFSTPTGQCVSVLFSTPYIIGYSVAFVVLLAIVGSAIAYGVLKKMRDDTWKIDYNHLVMPEVDEVLGAGSFGVVLRGSYRGTRIAVKKGKPTEGEAVGESVSTPRGRHHHRPVLHQGHHEGGPAHDASAGASSGPGPTSRAVSFSANAIGSRSSRRATLSASGLAGPSGPVLSPGLPQGSRVGSLDHPGPGASSYGSVGTKHHHDRPGVGKSLLPALVHYLAEGGGGGGTIDQSGSAARTLWSVQGGATSKVAPLKGAGTGSKGSLGSFGSVGISGGGGTKRSRASVGSSGGASNGWSSLEGQSCSSLAWACSKLMPRGATLRQQKKLSQQFIHEISHVVKSNRGN